MFVAVVFGTGCAPEVVTDTYFCGPERACPPEQTCDEVSLVCVRPSLARAFECGEFVEELGDETFDSATELGTAGCEQIVLTGERCFSSGGDDYYRFDLAEGCAGGNQLSIAVAFPLAFAPITVELLDEGGAVLAEAVDCLSSELFDGRSRRCLEFSVDTQTVYGIRVGIEAGDDCDGSCRYNRYAIIARVIRP